MQKITRKQYESLTDEQKKEWKKIQQQMKLEELYDQVSMEYLKCTDVTVMKYFDPENKENLEKKLEVLKKINSFENVDNDEYMSILDKAKSEDPDREIMIY